MNKPVLVQGEFGNDTIYGGDQGELVTRPNAQRPAGRYELYDLHADPGETKDLAAERPERVKDLAEILERQRTTRSRNP